MPFLLLFGFFEIDLILSWLLPIWNGHPVMFWTGFGILQILFASELWLYFFFFKSGADEKIRFEVPLRKFAFYAMGILSFLFTFTLLRDVLGLMLLTVGKASLLYGVSGTEIIFLLTLVACSLGSFNAHFRVESPEVAIRVPGLPPALHGLKIIQLSDMHLGTGPGLAQIKKLVDQALHLAPDLIVLTGDIIDGMIADLPEELAELSRLKAPHGVYFVLGNHECYWNWQESVAKFTEFGFVPLLNGGVVRTVNGKEIFIAGLTDPAIGETSGFSPKIPAPPASTAFNLMLVHQPQFAKEVTRFPYHLQLSGHTHGGQFFPWNLAVKKMYPISEGLGKAGLMFVYVSRGSGYWGPPLRLGTLGEVTKLVLS